MSLKAKIEAVIYAAEEPITLAQLASIFADEALAARSAAGLPFEVTQPENGAAPANETVEGDASAEPIADTAPATSDEGSGAGEQPALPLEDAEARKRARLREREARQALQPIVEELIAEYANGEHGMSVRSFVKSLKPQMKLSLQALETLAVIAYKQPVTAPEISEIRGVDTAGVLGGLMNRKLITTAGRKQVIGRPILYKTTKEFLLRFGLKDVGELPSMEEFEKMAADMAESDASDLDAMPSEFATVADTDAEASEPSVTETVTEERSTAETSGETSGSEP